MRMFLSDRLPLLVSVIPPRLRNPSPHFVPRSIIEDVDVEPIVLCVVSLKYMNLEIYSKIIIVGLTIYSKGGDVARIALFDEETKTTTYYKYRR